MGPFDAVADGGGGFEHFYGFIGGETNQYCPALYQGTTPVEPPKTPEEGYHFTEDIADHAIDWMRQQKALMPDKPFFVYFAPGATHAPHHVPKEWSDKYKGKFDQGWDKLREEIFARQKELGVIPADAELTGAADGDPGLGRHAGRPRSRCWRGRWRSTPGSWSTPTTTSAGWSTRSRSSSILDDTLIYLHHRRQRRLGRRHGSTARFNEMIMLNGMRRLSRRPSSMAAQIDKFGRPEAYNHYAVGWAHAMDTPYQWTKQVASHWGGTRNGTIVHWPKGIKAKGEIRSQFHHVIDVAPTVLEAAGLPEPTIVNGVQQKPLEGVSMAVLVRRRASAPSGARRSTSRCSATAASTTRAGPRSRSTAPLG